LEIPVTLDIPTLLAGFWATVPEGANYGKIGAAKLSTELVGSAPFLVDVRQTSEVETGGYIIGAINIPIRSLLDNLDKLPGLDAPIVLYDSTGHRGALGMMALRMLGYTNVRNLDGGTSAWAKGGVPFVTGSLPAEPVVRSARIVADESLFTVLNDFLGTLPQGFLSVKSDDLAIELAVHTPILIDVRTQTEWDEGHIEGALPIEFTTFLDNLNQLPADKNANIVIYCSNGHRSALVLGALHLLGYTEVRNLEGGIFAWEYAGLPVAP
jgi:rhodanese-related sulfurtransferase